MLMDAGVSPQVATATVTVMTAIVSSNATLNFVLASAIPFAPAMVLMSASFLGSLLGKTVVGWLVSRTGRSSIILFMLVGFLVISAVAALVQGGLGAAQELASGQNP